MPIEELRFEERRTESLYPPARTARLHPASQIDAIAKSIQRFSFVSPIVATRAGEIVVGEARWQAAKSIGRETVPVVIADHLSAAQVEAYRIADNRLAELATWDDAVLANVVRDLDLALTAEDLDALGFATDELSALLGTVDPIETPALPSHERDPFQRMTFVLHDSQVPAIEKALALAKGQGPFDGLNANGNGNALHRLCVAYVG